MEHIDKFKFWCHKVLPLVYDDSLSYYELLCKFTAKLNEMIDTINQQNEKVSEIDELKGMIDELRVMVEHFTDTPEFYQAIDEKLDEMITSGAFDTLFYSSTLGLADGLNLERLGTEYRADDVYTYSEIQGMTMDTPTVAYAYYVNSTNPYTNGMLRKFNPVTNRDYVIVEDINGGHGQTLATDDEYVYILNYYDSTGVSGDINHQYISICDKNTLEFIARYIVDFGSYDIISISNMFYDKEDSKLYIAGTSTVDEYTHLRIMPVIMDTENEKFVVSGLRMCNKNKRKGYVQTCCDKNYYYGLSTANGTVITIWNKRTLRLVRNININVESTDHMFLGEPEGLYVFDNGDIYLNFLAVITRATPFVRSGLYLNSIAKTNIFTNEVKIDTRASEIQTTPLNYLYCTHELNDLVKYYKNHGNSSDNDPLQSIYHALMFRHPNNNIVIYTDDKVNSTDMPIVIQGQNGTRFEFTGDANISTPFYIIDSNDITIHLEGDNHNTGIFEMRNSTAKTNFEVHNLTLISSTLTCTKVSEVNRIDDISSLYTIEGALTNANFKSDATQKYLPYMTRIYHACSTLSKTSDEIEADAPISSIKGTRWCAFRMTIGGEVYQSTPFIIFYDLGQFVTINGSNGSITAQVKVSPSTDTITIYNFGSSFSGNFTAMSLYII